ncbi:MAG: glycosyltransferase family 9 protein, partial [Gammaproteobacteria bacterium]
SYTSHAAAHLAAACGTPTVAIYGPTNEDIGHQDLIAWRCGAYAAGGKRCRALLPRA